MPDDYNVEVLLSVVGKDIDEIKKHLEKSNIRKNAIVINQNEVVDKKVILDNNIKIYCLNEKGVGLSRNNALMRAQNKIVAFADDDEIFDEQYEIIIKNAFQKIKDADIIIFNVPSLNEKRVSAHIHDSHRVYWYNSMRYGTFQITAKLDSIKKKRLYFSLLFGGGATYGSGEDSLFLIDALKAGLKVYTYNAKIATVEQKNSTWFQGYNEKFFFDRGALFAAAFKYPKILGVLQLLRKKNIYKTNISLKNRIKLFFEGVSSYNNENIK